MVWSVSVRPSVGYVCALHVCERERVFSPSINLNIPTVPDAVIGEHATTRIGVTLN